MTQATAKTIKYVSYLRVSTGRQGKSGLGIDAQRKAVSDYIGSGRAIEEFVEVESGKAANRPQLLKALSSARLHGATLVVAKLDRLARNAFFLFGLKNAGVDLICCDMPSANNLTIGIMAVIAEEEAKMISDRTKVALAAAKARGVKLGTPKNLTKQAMRLGVAASVASRTSKANERARDLRARIDALRAEGHSLASLAAQLNRHEVPTPRGRGPWTRTQVARVLQRTDIE